VEDLYSALWGEPVRRARFETPEHAIDVQKWGPDQSDEGVAIYATVGASLYPPDPARPTHRAEFITGLLPEQDAVASPLAALGLYAVRESRPVGHGHIVPADGPLWPGSLMTRFLVLRPRADFLPPLELPDGLHVDFLQAMPIFDSEREFVVDHGPDALVARWEEKGVPFWDPQRPETRLELR
jgi:hypothetical protein